MSTIPRRPVGATYRTRPQTRVTSPKETLDKAESFCPSAPSAVSKKEKRFGMADPAVWESVSRTLSQQYRLSNLVSPLRTPESQDYPEAVEGPSRSPAQKRTLKRFERDLEKYADATGARGKVAVAPSTATGSRTTLHTVDELLPFHRQFAAAGLAVTSAEQKGKSKSTRKHKYTTPRDQADMFQLDGGPSHRSLALSESSDSTMVRFTAADPDDPSHLLVDELPPPKQKHRIKRKLFKPHDQNEEKHKGKRWKRKKEARYARSSRLEQVMEDEPDAEVTTKLTGATKALPAILGGTEKRESLCKPLPKTRRDVDFATIHYQVPCPTGTTVPKTTRQPTKKSAADPKAQPNGDIAEEPSTQPKDAPRKLSKPHVRYPSQVAKDARLTGKRKPNQTLQQPRPQEETKARKQPEDAATPTAVAAGPSRARQARKRSEGRQPPQQSSEELDTRMTPSPVQVFPPSSEKPIVPQKSERRPKPVEQTTTSQKGKEKAPARKPQETSEKPSPPPELPFTWKYAVTGSSSLERALDAVRDKVDKEQEELIGMYEESAPTQREPSAAGWKKPKSKLRSPPSIVDQDRKVTSLSLNTAEQTVDYFDQDIDDRQVLKGLKMAIAAACDEKLDAFVRDRTGMRLRRFFADLTVFEDLEREWMQGRSGAASQSTAELTARVSQKENEKA